MTAPGQRVVATAADGPLHWFDLAYTHDGDEWIQRHIVTPHGWVVTAQARTAQSDDVLATATALARQISVGRCSGGVDGPEWPAGGLGAVLTDAASKIDHALLLPSFAARDRSGHGHADAGGGHADLARRIIDAEERGHGAVRQAPPGRPPTGGPRCSTPSPCG